MLCNGVCRVWRAKTLGSALSKASPTPALGLAGSERPDLYKQSPWDAFSCALFVCILWCLQMLCDSFDWFHLVGSMRTPNRLCSLWVEIARNYNEMLPPAHKDLIICSSQLYHVQCWWIFWDLLAINKMPF